MGDSTKVTVLKNDVYTDYSVEAYKAIYEAENGLRKFIYQLMARKIGFDWIEAVIPDGINTRSQNQESDESDFLHEIYLSDLERILFVGQRDKEFRNMDKIELFIRRAKKKHRTSIK